MRKLFFAVRVVLVVVLSFIVAAPILAADTAQDVPVIELSGTALGALVALVISLAVEIVPGLKARWESFQYKRETLMALGFVLAWGMIGLHYLGAVVVSGVGAWGWPVVWKALEAWFAFSGVGQIAYTAQKWTVAQ
jgi:hypothetical protein